MLLPRFSLPALLQRWQPMRLATRSAKSSAKEATTRPKRDYEEEFFEHFPLLKARISKGSHVLPDPVAFSVPILQSWDFPCEPYRLKLTPDTKINVGALLQLTPEHSDSVLPEQATGQLKDVLKLTNQASVLVRLPTKRIVERLESAKHNNFLAANGVKPIVITGYKGVGKSAVLQQVAMWGRSNGWLTVFVPDCLEIFRRGDNLFPSRIQRGLWDQPKNGHAIVSALFKSAGPLLAKLPLRSQVKVGTFQSNEHSTLLQLVQFGANNAEYACDALYHFRHELYRVTEVPVLLVVDDINGFAAKSSYLDPWTEVNEFIRLRGRSLTIGHLFGDLDPLLPSGILVTAETGRTKSIDFGDAVEKCEVPRYTKQEYFAIINHYKECGIVLSDLPNETADYIYHMCCGIGEQVFKYYRTYF